MTERNDAKLRKQVEFWREDLAWLEKTHPGASLSWLVNLLIHSYREVCDNPETYNKYIEDLTIFSVTKVSAAQSRAEIKETYK